MKRLAMYALAGAFSLMVASGPSEAATASGSLTVNAELYASCTVATTPVTFPGTAPTSTSVTATGDVAVNCSNGTPYTIALDAGGNIDATGTRTVSDGAGGIVGYVLYQDSGMTTEWGDDGSTHTGGTVADTGTGADQPHTVHGVMRVDATDKAGTYTDVVNVAVSF